MLQVIAGRVCCLFALVFVAVVAMAVPATAQTRDSTPAPAARIGYDIASQDLAEALNAYAAASSTQVLYETSLTAGRRSASVQGQLTPEAALKMLLAGTGLIAHRTDVDAITIVPEQRGQAVTPSAPDARFLGSLQAGVVDALCRSSETRPGNYRMALQLWINSAGVIGRAALLGSTGDARRDAALADILPGVQLGAAPPRDMPQPITLAIVPRSPLQPSECTDR